MKKIILPLSEKIEEALCETIKHRYPELSGIGIGQTIKYNKNDTGAYNATVTFYTKDGKFGTGLGL